jgi:DNA-binding MarR family transcriptional regulator
LFRRTNNSTGASRVADPLNAAVLATLRGLPPPCELTPTELYGAVLISSGGLTKVLYGLEQRGLISRVADDTDGRSRRVRLTPAGRALAERTLATLQASGEELFGTGLSAADMARLASLLRKALLAVER